MRTTRRYGFTLVELMVAIVIGSILLLGIATLFTNTTNNIRLQRGIANIQENGRLLSEYFRQDISGAGTQYCANHSFQEAIQGFTPRRPLLNLIPVGNSRGNDDNLANYVTTTSGLTGGTFYGLPGIADHPVPAVLDPADERIPNWIAARFTIQGHDCVGNACTPLLTVLGAARTETGQTAAPDVGTAVGNRVPNSDVLSFRTLVGSGASIVSPLASGNGFNLAPQSLSRLGLNNTPVGRHSQRAVMIADCNKVTLYRGDISGTTLTIPIPLGSGSDFESKNNARVFDMENQWLTVTYYLQFVADPSTAGRIIPALMRRENGRNPEELARGIERLDFRYSVSVGDATVEDNSQWLTAAQVQNRNGGIIPCPTNGLFGVLDDFGSWDPTNSCLWTSVRAIEVGFSATSIDPLAFSDDETNYTMENERGVPTADRMLHREFRVFIPIKAWSR